MPCLYRLTLWTAAILGCLAPFAVVAETLTIGTMDQGVRAQMKQYEPFTAYIEREMQGTAITEVQMMVVSSAAQMAEAISKDKVDIFLDCPIVAGKVAKISGAQPFMYHREDPAAPFYSVIIAHVESGIASLADLERKTIAFSERDSSAGFLLPAHMITRSGLTLREKLSREHLAGKGEVNFLFSAYDKNAIYLLANNRVDAAAVSLESFSALRHARPGEYRIIAKSDEFPSKVMLHTDTLDQETLAKLRSVLTAMSGTQDGRNVLRKTKHTSAFDAFPDQQDMLFGQISQILEDLEDVGIK